MRKIVAVVMAVMFFAAVWIVTAQTFTTVPTGSPLVLNEANGFGPIVGATVRSGAKGSTVAALVTSESIDANTQALHVIVGQKATYYFATAAKTATAAGTGPFFAVCGSGTKTVRLQHLIIGGTVATAAVYGDVQLRKTSTATSAGTATALTKVPASSGLAASTASLLNFYTALATTGANVGFVGSQSAVFPITGTVAASTATVLFDWTNRQESQAPILIGTGQCIEASFGTTTANAPTLTVQGSYTEE